MREADKSFGDAASENFAAPDCSVIAVSSAVEADAYNSLIPFLVFGENGCDVRAVMLDGNLFAGLKILGESCRDIAGMRVVNNDQLIAANFIHGKKVANCLLEWNAGFEILEIADVLADERLACNHDGYCILEIGAQRQNRAVT